MRSLRYFTSLLEDVREESFLASYRQYLESEIRRCERLEVPEAAASVSGQMWYR